MCCNAKLKRYLANGSIVHLMKMCGDESVVNEQKFSVFLYSDLSADRIHEFHDQLQKIITSQLEIWNGRPGYKMGEILTVTITEILPFDNINIAY
jgi:hypothetical protein